jgi:hypothetical protein
MSRNVFPENALSLRFHVLSFPCLSAKNWRQLSTRPLANKDTKSHLRTSNTKQEVMGTEKSTINFS